MSVTVINLNPYKEQPLPEAGKEYHIFDDGKIRPNRHFQIKVLELIPPEEVDSEQLKYWRSEVEECYWLYAPETDFFVKAKWDVDEDPLYFVRTVDGGWFSLGWWGARLDIDSSLYEQMVKDYF